MARSKQTAQGVCFMNERQPNSWELEDRSGWQRRNIRLLWLMWPSTQRIGILEWALSCSLWDIWGLLYCDQRRSAVTFTPLWFNFINNYTSLVTFSRFIIPFFWFCYVFDHENIHNIRVLPVSEFYYRMRARNLTQRENIQAVLFVFSLRIFVSAQVTITLITALDMFKNLLWFFCSYLSAGLFRNIALN